MFSAKQFLDVVTPYALVGRDTTVSEKHTVSTFTVEHGVTWGNSFPFAVYVMNTNWMLDVQASFSSSLFTQWQVQSHGQPSTTTFIILTSAKYLILLFQITLRFIECLQNRLPASCVRRSYKNYAIHFPFYASKLKQTGNCILGHWLLYKVLVSVAWVVKYTAQGDTVKMHNSRTQNCKFYFTVKPR
jgi:hypothetical protein